MFCKVLITALSLITVAVPSASDIDETTDSNITSSRKSHRGKRALRNQNPELYQEISEKRQEWKNLERDERKKARAEWLKNNPAAKSMMNVGRKDVRQRALKNLKSSNPDLFEKFQTEKKRWKTLPKSERKEARQAFVKAHPELANLIHSGPKQSKHESKKLANLSETQVKQLAEARKSWKNLSPQDRKKARKQFMKANPEIRKSLKKFNRKRKKKAENEVFNDDLEL